MRITDKVTAYFIDREIIAEEKQDIFEYGFELIFADIINFAIVLLVSTWFNDLGVGLVYLLCFVSTRIFCGGFHADTHALCGISMLGMFCCFMAVYRALDITQTHVIFSGLAIAWIPIIGCVPVIHKNKPLSYQYRISKEELAKSTLYLRCMDIYFSCIYTFRDSIGRCNCCNDLDCLC